MTSSITDLESQLLALTKRRVEIDSQWIEISEKLLAAKGVVSDAEKQAEVPLISETTEANSIVSPIQTTIAHSQSRATRNKTGLNIGNVQSDAESSQPVRAATLAIGTSTIAASDFDAPPKSSHPEETIRQLMPQNIPTIPPPPSSFPESTSNHPLSQHTHSEASGYNPNAVILHQPQQNVSSQDLGIVLGNRQLLRPSSFSNDTQSQQDIHTMSQNTSAPTSEGGPQSTQPLFSHMLPRFPQNPIHLDPRLFATWQPQQQGMMSPRQIKAENIPYPLGQQGASRVLQDQNMTQLPPGYFPMPHQPLFSSTMEPFSVMSQSITQDRGQAQPDRPAQTPAKSGTNYSRPFPQDVNTSRRRQRSPSVQIIDARPRQRPRLADASFDRISTPPINAHIKVEEGTQPNLAPTGHSDRFSRAQAPPPQPTNLSTSSEHDVGPVSTRPRSGHNSVVSVTRSVEVHNANVTDKQPFHRQLLAPGSHRRVPTRAVNQDYNRGNNNDDEEEEEESESEVDDEVVVPRIRYQRPQMSNPRLENLIEYNDETSSPLTARLATRRAFNAYRVNEPKPPLSYAERQELELRYCARVAMIIGSKRCVIAPCVQVSKMRNIFTIMRQKFGHIEEDQSVEPVDPNTLYRSASDFVTDARGMLKCYVKLGHCDPCPFRTTGNERVMCWRMRLESVLDEKMRGLKKCLKECEDIYDVDDMDGRAKHVDTWFSDEELRDEVPML